MKLRVGTGVGGSRDIGRSTVFDLLAFAATIAVGVFGYFTARRFVRDRLKFVDAAQTLRAPVIAGLVAWAIAMPLVWVLPLVGPGAAMLFGLSVGMGVRAGAKDIRSDRRISAG